MRKKINLILGALVALFGGCKTPKETVIPNDRIMVLYGPPAYFQQQDTTSQENLQENQSPIANRQSPINSSKLSNSKL